MRENHLWNSVRDVQFKVSDDILPGFDVDFDDRICEETKDALMQFAYWVEDHFAMPVTLWVDFKYNHYLVDQAGKRVGYKFYWVDFEDYPVFTNWDDLPVIELAVRTENRSLEAVLRSFAEAISHYYIWLSNQDPRNYQPDPDMVEEILSAYRN